MIEVNEFSSAEYSFNKKTRFKFSMLRSNLCDYSDTYISVKGTVDLLAAAEDENDKAEKEV